MALAIILETGLGVPDANSYATIEEADAYAESHLYAAAWTKATATRKIQALVMATRVLDASTRWASSKRLTLTQGLACPRVGMLGIPRAVKNATAELARLLLANDLTADIEQNNLKALNLGKGALEIDFKDSAEKKRIPSSVGELLEGWGIIGGPATGGIVMRRISR